MLKKYQFASYNDSLNPIADSIMHDFETVYLLVYGIVVLNRT